MLPLNSPQPVGATVASFWCLRCKQHASQVCWQRRRSNRNEESSIYPVRRDKNNQVSLYAYTKHNRNQDEARKRECSGPWTCTQ